MKLKNDWKPTKWTSMPLKFLARLQPLLLHNLKELQNSIDHLHLRVATIIANILNKHINQTSHFVIIPTTVEERDTLPQSVLPWVVGLRIEHIGKAITGSSITLLIRTKLQTTISRSPRILRNNQGLIIQAIPHISLEMNQQISL